METDNIGGNPEILLKNLGKIHPPRWALNESGEICNLLTLMWLTSAKAKSAARLAASAKTVKTGTARLTAS